MLDMYQVSEIVRQSLVYHYELNRHSDRIDCSDWVIDPDQRFLDALEQVINYYSTPEQYKEWQKTLEKVDE